MLEKYSYAQQYCLRQFGLEVFLGSTADVKSIDELTETAASPKAQQSRGKLLELLNADETTNKTNVDIKPTDVELSDIEQSIKKPIKPTAITSEIKQFILLINLESLDKLKYGKQLIYDLLKLLQIDLGAMQVILVNGDWHKQVQQLLKTKKTSIVLPQSPEICEKLNPVLKSLGDDKKTCCMPMILPSLNELLSEVASKEEVMQNVLPLLNCSMLFDC